MSADCPIMLLDTNIWLDAYIGDRANHNNASMLVDLAATREYTLTYAATSIKDFFYLYCADAKRRFRGRREALTESQARAAAAAAWGCLNNMTTIAVASPIGEPQIWLAEHMRNMHGDFEDNLVLAAVETSKADYFVTNDTSLLGKAACPTFTCTDMLAYLQR